MDENKRYVAFYTKVPFWAKDKVDINDRQNFRKNMGENVLSKSSSDYNIRISRDGMIQLRIHNIQERIKEFPSIQSPEYGIAFHNERALWSEYLLYINAFYFILSCNILESNDIPIPLVMKELSILDVSQVHYENDEFKGYTFPTSEHFIASRFDDRIMKPLDDYLPIEITYSKLLSCQIINIESLNSAIDMFSKHFNNLPLLKHFAVLTKALEEFASGKYEDCLISLWFEIEKILNSMLKRHIVKFHKTRTQCNKFLKKLKKQNISETIVDLKDDGLILSDLFHNLTTIRRKRNNIAHDNDRNINNEDAVITFHCIKKLIEIHYDEKFNVNLNLGVSKLLD